MNVQLLVVPDCANEPAARDLLTRALSDLGLADVNVGTRMVGSPELAAELGFVGSPTFLINGLDPFGEPLWLTSGMPKTSLPTWNSRSPTFSVTPSKEYPPRLVLGPPLPTGR